MEFRCLPPRCLAGCGGLEGGSEAARTADGAAMAWAPLGAAPLTVTSAPPPAPPTRQPLLREGMLSSGFPGVTLTWTNGNTPRLS